ncbi:MAG TPA: hypothetical protein VED40_06625 [Azospirillaceae bacterium]|nr:hypothetical protein [Azospirillaceae bacterium]
MLINLALGLVALACLIQAALTWRRMQSDRIARERRMVRLEEDHGRAEAARQAMQEVIDASAATLREIETATDGLRQVRDEAEIELKRLAEAPRQRLFVLDKGTIVHGKLWEVTVANDSFLRVVPAPRPAEEWAIGRVCLFGGATEREARQRAEGRLPPNMGYRVLKLSRFRRG